MTDRTISDAVQRIVKMLVDEEYSSLELLSLGRRLTADEIAQAIKDYGAILVMPPDESFADLDVIEIEGRSAKAWPVRFDLWTAREGRSDFTLELTLTEVGDRDLEVEMDGIHVL